MGILAWLLVAIAVFGAGTTVGIKWEAGVIARRDLAAQTLARENFRKQEIRIDTAAAGHEADKKALRAKFSPIDKEVDRVTQTDFYAAGQPACFDDDGLRQLRAAIATAPASASQPAGSVPRSGGTHWWDTAGDPALVR